MSYFVMKWFEHNLQIENRLTMPIYMYIDLLQYLTYAKVFSIFSTAVSVFHLLIDADFLNIKKASNYS